jgi:uncharacterized membrane protein YdfJ with MMPL/SSD domain
MGAGGVVVTTAGVVFGLTAMLSAVAIPLPQVDSTIGSGLLVDTFIVPAVVVSAIAALRVGWFWWPLAGQVTRSRTW